jgi:hypothetical protein
MQMQVAGSRFWNEKRGQQDYSDCWAILLHSLLYCLQDGSYGLISDPISFDVVSLDLVRILSNHVTKRIILNKKYANGLRNS